MDNVAPNPDAIPGIYDEKGRRFVGQMTDRELLEEMVETMRRTEDTVASFVMSLQTNPMFKMMGSKFGLKG